MILPLYIDSMYITIADTAVLQCTLSAVYVMREVSVHVQGGS